MPRQSETRKSRERRWAVRVGVLTGFVGVVLSLLAYYVRLYEDPAASDTPGALYLFGSVANSFINGVIFFLTGWGLTYLVGWLLRRATRSKT